MTAETRQSVGRSDERQDENVSLYRYIMDTAESVRRGPWDLRPAFMLREQLEADDATLRGRSGGRQRREQ